ncbi:(R)-mandelonitrile lyase-like [Punica granatum]|uniref:(R)-mandelonitrile lyase-like n=2 Tax=Punica granatum TaxID=22663 RepID=A0A6P8E8F3_PUNGR|nr:(R)-mandelonitrile lyase-like [Punica granatum]
MTAPHKIVRLFILFVFLVHGSSSFLFSPPQRKNLPHMTSDVEEVSGKSFDYIIVGGGTAGCPLAATLSEKFSVLLVERGGSPFENPLVMEKKYYGYSLFETDEFSSVAQSFVSVDGVRNLRGRVLGGSSAINGGFYSRASKEFVKKAGWNEEMVAKAYEWVESRVVFPPMLTPWQFTAEFGLLEAGILPYNGYTLEHVEGTKIGGTVFDQLGTRHTSADLLQGGNPENIIVLLNATVKNIIFHNNSDKNETCASGISFIRSDGTADETFEAVLSGANDSSSPLGDVILAAGAMGSPAILLLSGVGPPKHLKKFDIPIVVALKDVGRQLKDNPCISLMADSRPLNRPADPPQVAGIAKDLKFIIEAGVLPISANSTLVPVAAKLAFPKSKGRLKLNSMDPRENPTVKFNYLSKEEDLKQCVEMVEMLQRVVSSQAVTVFLGAEHKKDVLVGSEDLPGLCQKNVRTFYHYHGGCSVGSVVDSDYRVYGVKGLRVVDGSTFLESPGTNPMATLMMLGRYQGMKILQERDST